MSLRNHWLPPAALCAVVGLAGCAQSAVLAAGGSNGPVRVEAMPGAQVHRIILRPEAAQRLGVRTAPVRRTPAGATVPFSALLYDQHGQTWVYTSPTTDTYVRQQVEVARIDGNVVVLRNGPVVGTLVVTVAAPELLGSEQGVGGE